MRAGCRAGAPMCATASVVDLQIAAGEVTALVSGSRSTRSRSASRAVAKTQWEAICADCSGGIDSLVELLQGRFSKGVMERLCRQDTGLFPQPSEIRFACSCPDHASMCKHVAAVLYGVGARLDHRPELLFRLRAVDETEMLSNLGDALPDRRTQRDGTNTLVGGDLAALFDLDMEEGKAPATSRPPPHRPAPERNPTKAPRPQHRSPPRVKARGHRTEHPRGRQQQGQPLRSRETHPRVRNGGQAFSWLARGTKAAFNRPATALCTSPEITMPPGGASASSLAATFTPSP